MTMQKQIYCILSRNGGLLHIHNHLIILHSHGNSKGENIQSGRRIINARIASTKILMLYGFGHK
jgi:hypothetical protein